MTQRVVSPQPPRLHLPRPASPYLPSSEPPFALAVRAFPAHLGHRKDLDLLYPLERSHSWNWNFRSLEAGRLGNINVTVGGVSGNPLIIGPLGSSQTITSLVQQYQYGLVLGWGADVVNLIMTTPLHRFEEGSNEHQLLHGPTSITGPNVDLASINTTIQRTFTNGWTSPQVATNQYLISIVVGDYILLAQDLLGAPINFPVGVPTTVQYVITTTA